uniref:protein unc-80 homolog n=1 Tax=Myxine glutinosa TaxID=7769 RepID=UPI00358FE682
MGKRKTSQGLAAHEGQADSGIPLPIQTFLWRQTSAFIRPKLGKQYEASCVSFERVLVENKLQGLSPALCEAIQNVTRWQLIQTSLPHVLHCTATLLSNRNRLGHQDKLGVAETKLLHTLHWMLLDSAQDCCEHTSRIVSLGSVSQSLGATLHNLDGRVIVDGRSRHWLSSHLSMSDGEATARPTDGAMQGQDPGQIQGPGGGWVDSEQPDAAQYNTRDEKVWEEYRLPLSTVELFVYLLAPLINRIRESDLTFRLAGGMVIWQPLWEHLQPDVPAFTAPIGSSRTTVTAQRLQGSSRAGKDIRNEEKEKEFRVTCEICNPGVNHTGGSTSALCRCDLLSRPHVDPVIRKQDVNPLSIIKGNAASYFDVAVLRCLFQPQWAEEGVYWALTYCLQRLRRALDAKAGRGEAGLLPPRPRPRSHSVAAMPYLGADGRKSKDLTEQPQGEGSLLNCEACPRISLTSLRRQAVPDLSIELGANIFKRFKSRRDERKGSIPIPPFGKKRQRRIGVPFLVHEDPCDASPTRSTFSFAGGLERAPWQTAILAGSPMLRRSKSRSQTKRVPSPTHIGKHGRFSRRGSSDMGELDPLYGRRSHSQHALLSHSQHALLSEFPPEHSNSHMDPPLREVKSQISTISMATFNTTLASFNVGYSDSFVEHMRRLCSQTAIPEISHEPLACANLPRSLTDSCLAYSDMLPLPHVGTVQSSVGAFVLTDGSLNLKVVLKALSVVLRGDASSRIFDTALHIIHELLQLGTVPGCRQDGDRSDKVLVGAEAGAGVEGVREQADPKTRTGERRRDEKAGGKASPEIIKENISGENVHRLMLMLLIRIIKSLGCAYGCGEGHRGLSGDRLRSLAHDCLDRLYKLDKTGFKNTFRCYVRKDSLNNVVDFLHALLGFCMETMSDSKAGFGNDFASGEGRPMHCMESIVVGCTFKQLITRCASATHELHSSDNLGLFCDIRQCIQFVKETHGSIFRRVALSALLDSTNCAMPGKKSDPGPDHRAGSNRGAGATSGRIPGVPYESQGFVFNTQQHSPDPEELHGGVFGRKEFWRKVFKSQSANSESSSQSEQDTSECTTAHSGTTTDRRSRGRSRRATLRRKLKLPLGNWLKRGSLSGISDPREDLLDVASIDRLSFIRQSAKVKFTSTTKLSEVGVLEEARQEEEENFFKRLSKWRVSRRHPSKVAHQEEKDIEQMLEEHLAQEGERRRSLVNLSALRLGMKRLQFLFNCCSPGTVPDASILAATLDLEAPVLPRAALYLECARFVHRCNRGAWPEWMKGHFLPVPRRGLSRGRSPVPGTRRNQRLQWNAARLFYQWGEAIGARLAELCLAESESTSQIRSQGSDDDVKRQLKREDEEEDFLDDRSVNPTKCGCPYAVKMAACQLLLEITSFLRETFPVLPRPRTEPSGDFEVSRHRLDPELDRHRYDRKISFAGILDEPESELRESLHSSSHTLRSEISGEERRGPRRVRQGALRLLQIKGSRSFRLKKGGSLSSIRRAGSLKSGKSPRQDSESENEEAQLSQSRDTITDIGSQRSTSDPSIEPENAGSHGSDDSYHKTMPWLEVTIQLCKHQSFICSHIDYCQPSCYQRHGRSCARLIRALKLIYGDSGDASRDDCGLARPSRKKGLESKFHKSDKSSLRPPSLKKRTTEIIADGKKDPRMLKYLRHQVLTLAPAPLSLLIKSAVVLPEEMYSEVQPAAWELLLSSDEHMAAAAAAMFLLCAVKVPDHVSDMLLSEFQHEEVAQRVNAILRFGALWRFRYQVWPRMEEGAPQTFKVPPPSINFTLPSPILGIPSLPVFDPPWVPQTPDSVQEAITEDQSKSFSAKAVSRSHQRVEHILKNMQQEERKLRLGREASIISAVPITQKAGFEPSAAAVAGPAEQEEEEEGGNMASRRLSLSPSCASSNSHRNCSLRRSSVWSVRSTFSVEEEEHGVEHTPTHFALQPPQMIFPACIGACIVPIIQLLEDGQVQDDGVAVCAVAYEVLWGCLIEDPALILRHFLERFTISNQQEELIYLLRKLLLNVGDLPPQASHILFNYLVGLIMYFVRTPCNWGEEAMAATLSFLWQVAGSVEGLHFKDLKQTLKKEQCELKLLVTAAMPGTKTLVVHGPNECDIPTQLPVHEDTQFDAVLKESLEFFNIPESQYNRCFLMDRRRNLIHHNRSYVRDVYSFRRSVSPQLSLVKMDLEKGQSLIQQQVFMQKLEEVGRLLFLEALTRHQPQGHLQSHVSLLQEDLLRLPSFPRKAIDAEFSLFALPGGKELLGLDCLQKILWLRLLEQMFLGMPSEFPWGDEVMLFLNVLNGALVLHAEDSALFRQYIATTINTAVHFNHLFSLNGYQWILPTMLQVYTSYCSNTLLRETIEFACRQFYILHRKPFILQLFASVAPLLESPDSPNSGASGEVSAQCLFDLLVSLEKDSPDALDVLELVKVEKPLKSLDFCYGNEDLSFSISEAIKLCVTVVAYAPESFRSIQMLMVMEALVPCYLQRMKNVTQQQDSAISAREEVVAIAGLATSLQALLHSVEPLTRPMPAPQVSRLDQGYKAAASSNHTAGGTTTIRDDLRLLEEGAGLDPEELDERLAKEEFRRPRESLLNICTDFYKHCGPRLKILQSMAGEPRVAMLELLDIKSHIRLAEVAHALLKLSPYDGATMEGRGLRRYMTEMLPITDWTAELVRPALVLILKRLDRMFNKIHKMPTLRHQIEWEGASNLIKGVCITLQKQPIISFLPHVRSLINVCVNLVCGSSQGPPGQNLPYPMLQVMGVVGPSSVADGLPLLHLSPYLSPPLPFSSAVVRLVALQIQALKDDFPLNLVISPFTNNERREGMLLNLLIPFVLGVGSGNRDSPRLLQPDVLYLLHTVLNILLPLRVAGAARSKNLLLESSPGHPSGLSEMGRDGRRDGLIESTGQAAFLALKVLLVCFERQLGPFWYRLSLHVREMASRKVGVLAYWDFIDFIVRTRIPLFVLLRPFIQCKLLMLQPESAEEATVQRRIAEQLERRFIPRPLSRSSLIASFANDLKILKEAVHSGTAYQGKPSIGTMATSTSVFRTSLTATARSSADTGSVWQRESDLSLQTSQDTIHHMDGHSVSLPCVDRPSVSMPSMVSVHEDDAAKCSTHRRLSSHVTCLPTSHAPSHSYTILPSHSEPNVLEQSTGMSAGSDLARVASVQSEPGQQIPLQQPALGRKKGLKQPRRYLLSRDPRRQEQSSHHAARLSTIQRRSFQPKGHASGSPPTSPSSSSRRNSVAASVEQKRSVTFTEGAVSNAEAVGAVGASPGPQEKAEAEKGEDGSTSRVMVTVADLQVSKESDFVAEMEAEFCRGLLAHGLGNHLVSQTCSRNQQVEKPEGETSPLLCQEGVPDCKVYDSGSTELDQSVLTSPDLFHTAEVEQAQAIVNESHV